jgi:hypothetical protein
MRTLSVSYKAQLKPGTYPVGDALQLGYQERLAGSPDAMGNALVTHGWSADGGSVTVDVASATQLILHFSATFKPAAGGTATFRLNGSIRCDHINP